MSPVETLKFPSMVLKAIGSLDKPTYKTIKQYITEHYNVSECEDVDAQIQLNILRMIKHGVIKKMDLN